MTKTTEQILMEEGYCCKFIVNKLNCLNCLKIDIKKLVSENRDKMMEIESLKKTIKELESSLV
jgi:hypothetical protein